MSNISTDQTIEQLQQMTSQNKITYKQMFNMHNTIDSMKAAELIRKALNTANKDAQEIGSDMENVVHYFLENTGIIQNVSANHKNKLHEIDHYGEISPHLVEYFKGKRIDQINFIGESKNYSSSLNVDKVYKLEGIKLLTKSKLGAFFTRFGLKGEVESSAKGVLAEFYHQFGHISLVFTKDDWEFLEKNPNKFAVLFYDKFSNFHPLYDSESSDHAKL